jgi:hypothetical protein
MRPLILKASLRQEVRNLHLDHMEYNLHWRQPDSMDCKEVAVRGLY